MMMNCKMCLGLSVLLLCVEAYSSVEAAELHKWIDEQGNLHITDIPPPSHEGAATPAGPESAPPASRIVPKKTTVKPPSSAGRSRAEILRVPGPTAAPQSPVHDREGVPSPVVGLRPEQATGTSPWEVFEGKREHAKAGVQRWVDEKGLEHLADVVPSRKKSGG